MGCVRDLESIVHSVTSFTAEKELLLSNKKCCRVYSNMFSAGTEFFQRGITMAKIAAHGKEVGTLYGLTNAKRYMSDGHVLKNIGFGWKLHARVKAGVSPQEAFETAKCKLETRLAERPLLAAYRAELHSMCGLAKRWKLHQAISIMPDDCDGVWSTACDGYGDNISADVDEVGNICRLYKNAIAESDEMKVAA